MIDNLSKKELDKLCEQQNAIINSNYDRIVVSAGPGSGKTYTIVRKIAKELKESLGKRIIACSFTREASNQLKDKIEQFVDAEDCFIGTIDSMLINLIYVDNFRSIYRYLFKEYPMIDLSFIMPSQKKELPVNQITRLSTKCSDEMRKKYASEWCEKFKKGIYEISYYGYVLATHILSKKQQIAKNISYAYSTIYIDEAQDLNYYQLEFIKVFIQKCNLKCILIGDKNQSIYEFRGARPELFYKLKNEGFNEYPITISVRCQESIFDISNCFIDNKTPSKHDDNRVSFGGLPSDFKDINDKHFFVLTSTNESAEFLNKVLNSQGVNSVYTRPIKYNANAFLEANADIVEESIKYFFNRKRKRITDMYSTDSFKMYLSSFIALKQIDSVDWQNIHDGSLIDFLKHILKLCGLILPNNAIEFINSEMENFAVKNHYLIDKNQNKVMTIHASKGLEADYVFLILDHPPFKFDDEYKRKMYVGMTRAKNHLFITPFNSKYYDTDLGKQIIEYFKKLIHSMDV